MPQITKNIRGCKWWPAEVWPAKGSRYEQSTTKAAPKSRGEPKPHHGVKVTAPARRGRQAQAHPWAPPRNWWHPRRYSHDLQGHLRCSPRAPAPGGPRGSRGQRGRPGGLRAERGGRRHEVTPALPQNGAGGAAGPRRDRARRAGGRAGGATHLPVREAERAQVEWGGAGLDRQLLDGLHPCRGHSGRSRRGRRRRKGRGARSRRRTGRERPGSWGDGAAALSGLCPQREPESRNAAFHPRNGNTAASPPLFTGSPRLEETFKIIRFKRSPSTASVTLKPLNHIAQC